MTKSVVAALLILPLFYVGTTFAQTVDELQRKIDSYEEEVRKLDAEIAQYEKELIAIGEKKQTLQNALDALAVSRKQITARINATKKQISATELQIAQLDNHIGITQETIENNTKGLAESMRTLYQTDQAPLIELILEEPSLSVVWNDAEMLSQIQGAVEARIGALKVAKQSLSKNRNESAEKRAKLVRERQSLSAQEHSLIIAEREQKKLIEETKSQESAYQNIIKQKQAEKIAFEATLFDLASQLQYTLDPARVPPAGKGVLRWPLDNVFITQQFGKSSSAKRLYASGTHDGVDFRASIGTPVKAALSGVVLEVNQGAVANCQYGKWILVKHANGLSTLYAHLSDIAVQKGQTVTTHQIIGYAGNTGYSTGPHLHFTVYVSEALNFRPYTCKSGRSTMIPIANPSAYLNPLDYL